jgi:toxin ParE1/3/4
MNLPIHYRPQALVDIEEIAVFLGRHSVEAANRFVHRTELAIQTLAQFPEIGHKWSSKKEQLAGVRFWKPKGFKRYVIFYRPGPEHIDVLRVLHGSRDASVLRME